MKTEDNFVDLVDLSASSELVPHVYQAFQRVWKETIPVCGMPNMGFHDFLEEHELFHGKSLVEKVYLVLADLPYNIRRARNDENAVYERLGTSDMGDVVEVCKSMRKRVGHRHIFCSVLQFGQSFKLL